MQIIPSREDSLDRLVDENARQFSMSRKAWRAWCSTSWKWTGYIPRFPCLPQKNVR